MKLWKAGLGCSNCPTEMAWRGGVLHFLLGQRQFPLHAQAPLWKQGWLGSPCAGPEKLTLPGLLRTLAFPWQEREFSENLVFYM